MALDETNPFAAPSTLPLAFPPFDAIRPEHYRPAFDAGVAEHLAEIDAIAADAAPATFENTIEALERSGLLLDRTLRVFHEMANSMGTPELQALEAELMPAYSSHSDAVLLNAALFARVDAVHAGRHEAPLTEEQRRPGRSRCGTARRAGAAPR